ncbi:DUF6541 family protein [Geodermatophilus ruber]|uniref:4-amino-4-deoxy-L-arabinose transferase n=1 Tax=Geodermatophilus ruber TaxID=504800 RepID=A0A1I4L855_9ACTN|nr:DUF6541 family protein [Geodermatophilus ruber]SFL87205.1 hypothetical protein SAMN04488085_12069 [Geodermatophilus ruber]
MLATLTVSVLLLTVPGLLLALALGLRGWTAAGSAPVLTFALVVLGIVTVSVLGLDWTPLTFGVVTVIGVGLALAGTVLRRVRRRAPDDRSEPAGQPGGPGGLTWSLLAVLGTVVGAAVGFVTVVGGTGQLADPNQGFDALFHVNMIETITRTGQVSPATASALNGYAEGVSVYPDAFHAMASLISQVHGSSLTAINALMACIPLLGGLGLVALLRSLGMDRAAAVVPVVLACTTGYPFDLIWRGPIWVFVFGITFVPSFLVLLLQTLRRRTVPLAVALGVAAAGLALIHPSAALSAAIFAVCLVGSRWLANRTEVVRDLMVLAPAGVLAAVVALPLIGQAVVDTGAGTVVDWPVAQSAGEAAGELLLYNYENEYPQMWLALPAVVGLIVGWRIAALRWWYWGTGAFLVLCVLAASYEGRLVQLLTGPWWNDRFRFEGLVFLGLSVFAAVGVVAAGAAIAAVVCFLARRLAGRAVDARGSVTAVGVVLTVALMGLLSGFYIEENQERLRLAYVPGGGGSVSTADTAAFRVLADLAGDGPVLNDPNDGSAWMWALADVQPVFGAALTFPVKPPLPSERQLLIDGLNCLDSDEQVRQAIEDLGVQYVYTSEATILGGPTPNAGFRDLFEVDSLRPVYQEDGVTIYEIDPVDLQEAPDEACHLS